MIPRRTTLLLALASISIGALTLRAEPRAPAESSVRGAVANDDLAALANDVNLPAWTQLASSRSFTTIEEGWVAIYSPKDAVGAARDWSAQLKVARSFAGRTRTSGQRHWLDLFIKAGEAVGRQDAPQFTAALRALESDSPSGRIALAANPNFFTAK
jgi:hypothetical protein